MPSRSPSSRFCGLYATKSDTNARASRRARCDGSAWRNGLIGFFPSVGVPAAGVDIVGTGYGVGEVTVTEAPVTATGAGGAARAVTATGAGGAAGAVTATGAGGAAGAVIATGAGGAAGAGRTPSDTDGIAAGVGMRGTAGGGDIRDTVANGRAVVGSAGAERAGVGAESAGWRTDAG